MRFRSRNSKPPFFIDRFIQLLIATVASLPAVRADEVPVVGDRAALEVVLAAVATSRAALAEGSVDAAITAPGREGPLSDEEAELSLRWRGELAFTRFRGVIPFYRGGSEEIAGREWSMWERILRTPNVTHRFNPHGTTLSSFRFPSDSHRIGLVRHSRLWPPFDWFTNGMSDFEDEDSRWDVAFDPARVDANTTTETITVEAGRDEVRLSRTFENGNSDWAIASRDAGWNVVRYGADLSSGEYAGHRGTYDWGRAHGGTFWVRRMTGQRFTGSGDGPMVTWEFSNFRDSLPDDADFTRAALEIPSDERVTVYKVTENGRAARSLGPPRTPGVSEGKLRALGELLGEGSFLRGGQD